MPISPWPWPSLGVAPVPSSLAIAATALLPLSNALNGGLPYVPARPFLAIIGVTALLALLALTLPTRHALRARPIEAIGARE
jgi:putative ABC transport system permease protein